MTIATILINSIKDKEGMASCMQQL